MRQLVAWGAGVPSLPLCGGSRGRQHLKKPLLPSWKAAGHRCPSQRSLCGWCGGAHTDASWLEHLLEGCQGLNITLLQLLGSRRTPALSPAPSIPARPHSRGSVQPILPDPGFIARAVGLERRKLSCSQWLFLSFLVLSWFSEVGGAFPADGVGLAQHPLRARRCGCAAAPGTAERFPMARSARVLAPHRGFGWPRSLLLLIQQLPCKTLQGNN